MLKKKVKICQTGLLKLNFETRPKKRILRFLPKISAGHGWSWKFFFANFQILGPLGCQGWVVIPQNVKKVKITAPYCLRYAVTAFFTISRISLADGKREGQKVYRKIAIAVQNVKPLYFLSRSFEILEKYCQQSFFLY